MTRSFELDDSAYEVIARHVRTKARWFALAVAMGCVAFGVLLMFTLEWALTPTPTHFLMPGIVIGLGAAVPLSGYVLFRSRGISGERSVERLSGEFHWRSLGSAFMNPNDSEWARTFLVGDTEVGGPWEILWLRDRPTAGFVDRTVRHHLLLAIVDREGTVRFALPGYDPLAFGPRQIYATTMESA